MPEYVISRPLLLLASDLTRVAPRRTLPDWFKGDPAHKAGVSDHNIDDTPGWRTEQTDSDTIPEVRAVDLRLPLNAPFTPEQFVQFLVRECRAGRITWIRYIIYRSRIWTASGNWVTQRYTGDNPHNEHIHISCKASHDNSAQRVGIDRLVAAVNGGNDVELTTPGVKLINKPDAGIVWSDDSTTVGGALESLLFYTLWSRNLGLQNKALNEAANKLLEAQARIIQQLLSAIQSGGGSVDAAAIVSKLEETKAEIRAVGDRVAAEARDAVADLGEGGATQVRADVDG